MCEVRAESVNTFFATLDRSASAIVSENPQLNGTASSEFAGRLNELFSYFDCRFPWHYVQFISANAKFC